jgi:hypothetical protein
VRASAVWRRPTPRLISAAYAHPKPSPQTGVGFEARSIDMIKRLII